MFEIPLCFQRNLQIVRLHFAWVSAHKTKVMKMKTKNVAKNVVKGRRHGGFSMIIIYNTEILLQKNKTKINSILFFILFLVSAKKN